MKTDNEKHPFWLTALAAHLKDPHNIYGAPASESEIFNVRVAELLSRPLDVEMVRDRFLLARLTLGKHCELSKISALPGEHKQLTRLLEGVAFMLRDNIAGKNIKAQKKSLWISTIAAYEYAEKMRPTEQGFAIVAPVCAAAYAIQHIDFNFDSYGYYSQKRGDQHEVLSEARTQFLMALEFSPKRSFLGKIFGKLKQA